MKTIVFQFSKNRKMSKVRPVSRILGGSIVFKRKSSFLINSVLDTIITIFGAWIRYDFKLQNVSELTSCLRLDLHRDESMNLKMLETWSSRSDWWIKHERRAKNRIEVRIFFGEQLVVRNQYYQQYFSPSLWQWLKLLLILRSVCLGRNSRSFTVRPRVYWSFY